jgi:hypothetical protein
VFVFVGVRHSIVQLYAGFVITGISEVVRTTAERQRVADRAAIAELGAVPTVRVWRLQVQVSFRVDLHSVANLKPEK